MKQLTLTREEIYRAEKLTEQDYGLPMLTLMENAGRAAADAARRQMERSGGREILVVAGRGNNGGDGFVAARHLAAAGYRVLVYYLGSPDKYTPISFTNFQFLHTISVATLPLERPNLKEIEGRAADLVIDGVFGIGVRGAIREFELEVIASINDNPAPVLSLDIPSGLDADTGEIHGAAVRAKTTVSFGFLKKGFYTGHGPDVCGKIVLADIGYPQEIYETNAECGVRNAE